MLENWGTLSLSSLQVRVFSPAIYLFSIIHTKLWPKDRYSGNAWTQERKETKPRKASLDPDAQTQDCLQHAGKATSRAGLVIDKAGQRHCTLACTQANETEVLRAYMTEQCCNVKVSWNGLEKAAELDTMKST